MKPRVLVLYVSMFLKMKFFKSEIILPSGAIAVKQSIITQKAPSMGERAFAWMIGTVLPQTPSVTLVNHLLAESVNSCNI